MDCITGWPKMAQYHLVGLAPDLNFIIFSHVTYYFLFVYRFSYKISFFSRAISNEEPGTLVSVSCLIQKNCNVSSVKLLSRSLSVTLTFLLKNMLSPLWECVVCILFSCAANKTDPYHTIHLWLENIRFINPNSAITEKPPKPQISELSKSFSRLILTTMCPLTPALLILCWCCSWWRLVHCQTCKISIKGYFWLAWKYFE